MDFVSNEKSIPMHQSMYFFGFYMQNLQRFMVTLVDYPKLSGVLDVRLVIILIINMLLLCKISNCWFCVGFCFSILWLK
jgi:hypothetical protein